MTEHPLASREETEEVEAGVLHVYTLQEWRLDSGKQMGMNLTRPRWQSQETMALCG